jgi:hypothetical protein
LLIEIVIDQGLQFTPNLIETHMNLYKIQHNKSVTYHSQENIQVEMTNKELENIITKTIKKHRRDWENRLTKVVWAYNTTWKTTTMFTPYDLVYGKKVMLPIEFEIQTLRTTLQLGLELSEAQ